MRRSLKFYFSHASVLFLNIDLSCNELFPMDSVVILATSLVAFHLKKEDLRHADYEEVLGLELHLQGSMHTTLFSGFS